VLREKLPHHFCGTGFIDCPTKDPFRQVFAAEPSMASTFDRIQHYVSILSAVRVGKTLDTWSNPKVNGVATHLFRCAKRAVNS
jgi:hypothetical protein